MPVIEVRNLTKYYGKHIGIENISLRIERGEIFGFLGPNGAGKTTTIRLLMQLLNPDSGSISIFGKPQKKNAFSYRGQIGYLPGEFKAYSAMSGFGFLEYFSRYRNRPPKLRSDLIEQLNITSEDLKKRIKNLSHGIRQKLGLILAMEHNPDLLILDEPTLGLDPLMQEVFYQIIKDFQQKEKTVFISSHILSEIEKICMRVAIIREGKLAVIETLENLKRKKQRHMIIRFKDPQPNQVYQISGTKLIARDNNLCTYLVESDLPVLFKTLASLPVEDIIFPEARLEDVFNAYYKNESA